MLLNDVQVLYTANTKLCLYFSAMPQLKVPTTLYNMALSKTRGCILRFGKYINLSLGNYENEECKRVVLQINQYLIHNVPAAIIEELYNSEELMVDTEDQNNESTPLVAFDPRVVLAMYINPNLTFLMTHKFAKDNFWTSTLPCMERLTKLDLSKVCTDEILELVGKHCRNLEFVNIKAKSSYTRAKDRHNALKLQLCVSDVGLEYLSNCKRLKEIQMTCIIRRGCGGRQITNEGIKKLVLSLPMLRRINYSDTGMLLDLLPDDSEKLSLISVIDFHPIAARIPKLEMLCPNLSELHLTYAFSIDDFRNDVILALANSKVRILNLSLTNFPFDENVKKYLELKGADLKVFSFVYCSVNSANDMFELIGQSCPDLECLQVHFLVLEASTTGNRNSFDSYIGESKMFTKLKCLHLKGLFWESNYLLPLLLRNAEHIQKLILTKSQSFGLLDDALHLIQKTNLLQHLETVQFLKGVNVSYNYLKCFILSCPTLKSVTIESVCDTYLDCVNRLRKEFISKNYDVIIRVL